MTDGNTENQKSSTNSSSTRVSNESEHPKKEASATNKVASIRSDIIFVPSSKPATASNTNPMNSSRNPSSSSISIPSEEETFLKLFPEYLVPISTLKGQLVNMEKNLRDPSLMAKLPGSFYANHCDKCIGLINSLSDGGRKLVEKTTLFK